MPRPFGNIFSEEITKTRKRMRRDSRLSAESIYTPHTNRIFFFVILLIIGLGFLVSKLFLLTIIEGRRFRILAQENRVRETKITAPRGIIYDRDGNALVRNIPVFVSSDGEFFFDQKDGGSKKLVESITREYLYNDLYAHVIGYTGEVSQDDLENQINLNQSHKLVTNVQELKVGDIIGKMGVEQYYDVFLRGRAGKILYEVDALEEKERVLGSVPPVTGENITLSLDTQLQKSAKDALGEKIGAIVAVDPKNGEVLSLISSPTFDPNAFIRDENIERILFDSDQPLFNRSISGLYPPGSTFKIITAIAALESGKIDQNTRVEDTGVLEVGDYSYANWYFTQYGKKEGMVNIVKAIKRSNDIYFYKVGEKIGIEQIASWARKMKLEESLGIDIKGEVKGLMPDPKWRKDVKGEDWYTGNTYHVSIGQGDILATPLQINSWTNVVANDGKLCLPHLLKSEKSKSVYFRDLECIDLGISKETVDLVKEGMTQACQAAPPEGGVGGTGWPLFNFEVPLEKEDGTKIKRLKIDDQNFFAAPVSTFSAKPYVSIPVACKTGTAEFADSKKRTHAWFTAFAPVKDPEISVTVLVEAGGEGSSVAGPIAKKVLEAWFSE